MDQVIKLGRRWYGKPVKVQGGGCQGFGVQGEENAEDSVFSLFNKLEVEVQVEEREEEIAVFFATIMVMHRYFEIILRMDNRGL